jgi:hypothetical protein
MATKTSRLLLAIITLSIILLVGYLGFVVRDWVAAFWILAIAGTTYLLTYSLHNHKDYWHMAGGIALFAFGLYALFGTSGTSILFDFLFFLSLMAFGLILFAKKAQSKWGLMDKFASIIPGGSDENANVYGQAVSPADKEKHDKYWKRINVAVVTVPIIIIVVIWNFQTITTGFVSILGSIVSGSSSIANSGWNLVSKYFPMAVVAALCVMAVFAKSKRQTSIALIGLIFILYAGYWKGNGSQQTNAAQEHRRSSQKIVFCANEFRVLSEATMAMDCRSACSKYAEDINDYMGQGWRVVSSAPKRVIEKAADSRYDYQQCACIGTEYVISR